MSRPANAALESRRNPLQRARPPGMGSYHGERRAIERPLRSCRPHRPTSSRGIRPAVRSRPAARHRSVCRLRGSRQKPSSRRMGLALRPDPRLLEDRGRSAFHGGSSDVSVVPAGGRQPQGRPDPRLRRGARRTGRAGAGLHRSSSETRRSSLRDVALPSTSVDHSRPQVMKVPPASPGSTGST